MRPAAHFRESIAGNVGLATRKDFCQTGESASECTVKKCLNALVGNGVLHVVEQHRSSSFQSETSPGAARGLFVGTPCGPCCHRDLRIVLSRSCSPDRTFHTDVTHLTHQSVES